jgi:FkbM family methyltransferase
MARSLKNYFMGLARSASGSPPGSLQPDQNAADDEVPSHPDLSYSAAGEDRLVLSWLQVVYQLNDASKIRYCDIGAAAPKTLNNTYALYARGASGVLIEPDPEQAQVLQSARPRDTVLSVGVAFDERRSATLRKFTSRVFNTFSDEQANVVLESSKNWHPSQRQTIVGEVEVQLVPVNEILAKHFPDGEIHFMSIDTEGVDFLILQSIDFNRFRPKMICIELSRPTTDLDKLLKPFGYEFVARSPDNAIYRLT